MSVAAELSWAPGAGGDGTATELTTRLIGGLSTDISTKASLQLLAQHLDGNGRPPPCERSVARNSSSKFGLGFALCAILGGCFVRDAALATLPKEARRETSLPPLEKLRARYLVRIAEAWNVVDKRLYVSANTPLTSNDLAIKIGFGRHGTDFKVSSSDTHLGRA